MSKILLQPSIADRREYAPRIAYFMFSLFAKHLEIKKVEVR